MNRMNDTETREAYHARYTHFVFYRDGVELFRTEPQPEPAALRALRVLSNGFTHAAWEQLHVVRHDRDVRDERSLTETLPRQPEVLGVNYYVWHGVQRGHYNDAGTVKAFCVALAYLDGETLQPYVGLVDAGSPDDTGTTHDADTALALARKALWEGLLFHHPHLLPQRFDGRFDEACAYVGLRLYEGVQRTDNFSHVANAEVRGWAGRE